jgi:hypothetical protein
MMPVLVDSNVLLDIVTRDPRCYAWSANALATSAARDLLCINPLIYAVAAHDS